MKFKPGDLCLVVCDPTHRFVGEIVEIVEVGPMKRLLTNGGNGLHWGIVDYRVNIRGNDMMYCMEWELIKIDPPSDAQETEQQEKLEA